MRPQFLARLPVSAGSLALLFVCALVSIGLWQPNGLLATRAGGDSPFLLIRVNQLAVALSDGMLPARWMPDAAFGLGYPFFDFYAALPFYLAALLALGGIDILFAIKLTQTLGLILAAFGMRALARHVWSTNDAAATLAAIAYTVAPFHLANIYTRGDSLSELWAFAWFPLILAAIHDAAAKPTPGALLKLAAALAGLVLTHNVSALLFAPFILAWSLAMLWQRRADLRSASVAAAGLLGAAALGAALSAWFWYPALSGTTTAQLGEQTTGFFNHANHVRQLGLCTPTVSVNSCPDRATDQVNLIQSTLFVDGAPPAAFALGLLQAMLTIAGALIWATLRTRARWLALIAALTLLTVFLITPLATTLWRAVPLLQLAQFPWRFLSIQALFGSLLIGALALRNGSPRTNAATALAAACALTTTALPMTLNIPTLDVQRDDITPRSIQWFEWYAGIIGTTIRAEYLPRTTLPVPATGPDVLGQPRAALIAQEGLPPEALTSSVESIETAEQRWRIVVAAERVRMTLPLLHTPAWTATEARTGAPIAIAAYPGSGWVELTLPRGEHTIALRHSGTPVQRTAETISALATLPALALALLAVRGVNTAARRQWLLALAVFVLIALAAVFADRLTRRKTLAGSSATWVDFGQRPFVHGGEQTIFDPTVSVPPDQPQPQALLLGASVEPRQLRAGEVFTLTLRWRDRPGPLDMTIETPSGSERYSYFRTGRLQSELVSALSTHTVPSDALPGPLLIALTPRAPWTALVGNNTVVGGAARPGFTLLGPTVTGTPPNAPRTALATLANGMRLHEIDWLRHDGDGACFRAHWSRAGAVNRADALVVSYKLFGDDGALVIQGDAQPLSGLAPTWSWQDDVGVRDSICVARSDAKRVLRQGERYRLEIAWYRAATGEVTGQTALSGVADMRDGALNAPAP
jgi:hypothetical protein